HLVLQIKLSQKISMESRLPESCMENYYQICSIIILYTLNRLASSVSTTFLVLEIISYLGSPHHHKSYHYFSPLCFSLVGSSNHIPSSLAFQLSTIHSHWDFHALLVLRYPPSHLQYHDVTF